LLLDIGERRASCAEQRWVVRRGEEEGGKFVCFIAEEKIDVCKEKV